MLEIKYSVTEMKNTFDRLITRLGMATEIISGLEDISTKIFKIEIQREKKVEDMELNIQETWNFTRWN